MDHRNVYSRVAATVQLSAIQCILVAAAERKKSCQTLYADENVGMRAAAAEAAKMAPLLANFRALLLQDTSV